MTAATRVCPSCGAEVGAVLTMCLYCGLPLTPQAQAPLISDVLQDLPAPPPAGPVARPPVPPPPVAPSVAPGPLTPAPPTGPRPPVASPVVPPVSPPVVPAGPVGRPPVSPPVVPPVAPPPVAPPPVAPPPVAPPPVSQPVVPAPSGSAAPDDAAVEDRDHGPSALEVQPAPAPGSVSLGASALAAVGAPASGLVGERRDRSAPEVAHVVGPLELILDTGQRVRLAGPGLIGRNPASLDPVVTCTAVPDPGWSVSKVHLEYGVEARGPWIRDRGSTNGSYLVRGGAPPSPLAPGRPVFLEVGDTIQFGQRWGRVDVAAP